MQADAAPNRSTIWVSSRCGARHLRGAWSAVEFAAGRPPRRHALPPGPCPGAAAGRYDGRRTDREGPVRVRSAAVDGEQAHAARSSPGCLPPGMPTSVVRSAWPRSGDTGRKSSIACCPFSPLARHLARSQDGPGPIACRFENITSPCWRSPLPTTLSVWPLRRKRLPMPCRWTSRDLPQRRTPPRRTTSRPDRTNHVVSSWWLT